MPIPWDLLLLNRWITTCGVNILILGERSLFYIQGVQIAIQRINQLLKIGFIQRGKVGGLIAADGLTAVAANKGGGAILASAVGSIDNTAVASHQRTACGIDIIYYLTATNNTCIGIGEGATASDTANGCDMQLLDAGVLAQAGKQRTAIEAVDITVATKEGAIEGMASIAYTNPLSASRRINLSLKSTPAFTSLAKDKSCEAEVMR